MDGAWCAVRFHSQFKTKKMGNTKSKNSNEIRFTTKEVQIMIMEAFVKGENWGVTYSEWFEPTQAEKANEAAESCEKILHKGLISKI